MLELSKKFMLKEGNDETFWGEINEEGEGKFSNFLNL